MKSTHSKDNSKLPERTLPALYSYIPQDDDVITKMIVLFNSEYDGTVVCVEPINNERYIGQVIYGFISCYSSVWKRLPDNETVVLMN